MDLEAGSAVLLSLVHTYLLAEVDAIDISYRCIASRRAERSRSRHGATKCSQSVLDLFRDLPKEKYNLIVSNPPYVDEKI
ncbi:methyltransferase [Vibrio chagasii]|nr:methyltransferase [Vibrio chagasii]